jgi:predicted AlkP superfamily phosphohydrolase/phosphomutase/tetratricopeptide (TPR) repeat protein
MTKKVNRKILLIGWDSADWGVIEPLMSQGKMPALQKLIREGVYGKLQTLDPPLSPMLWTSIATGFRADKHGIGGFIEPLPDGSGLRPVTSTSRKVKAIWNILNQEGKKSNVVGWWPSNPVEPINGVMVSNLYQVATKPLGEEWKAPAGTIHPAEMEEELLGYRIHPGEITYSMISPFIPNLKDNKELRKAKRANNAVKVLAEASSIHAVSTHLMEETEWDFMAVYHDALDHFSHLAMKFHPPKREIIRQEDFDNYKDIVESGYRFHDMMLERTLDLIDDNTTVILISDHGFHSDHKRPSYIPKEPSGPAVEHSPFGIFVAKGPGIKKGGQEIFGSSIIDITPTLLTLYDLPVGEDMEGKVLQQCFENPVVVKMIESWEKVEGDAGMHNKEIREDPWAAQEALQQLVELGYIEELDDDKLQNVEKAKIESQYYIARNLIDGNKTSEAILILEKIFSDTKIVRYGQRLAYAYLSKKMYKKCHDLISELRLLERENKIAERQRNAENAQKKGKDIDLNKDPFANSEMEDPMYLDYIEGLLLIAMNQQWKALPILTKVQKKNKNNAAVSLNIGTIYNLKKKYSEAEKHFINALAIDESNLQAHIGLGVSFLRRKKYNEAIDEFLRALELNFYTANAHYFLGEALMGLKDHQNAAEAFEIAIRLSPGMTKAHKSLIKIYSNFVLNPDKAEFHRKFILENITSELIVVTGLSREENKNVAKVLNEVGLELIFDSEKTLNTGRRKSLAKEFREINALGRNIDLQKASSGKVIIVDPKHLSHLPQIINYKLILVNNDINSDLLEAKSSKKVVKKNALDMKVYNKLKIDQNAINDWLESQVDLMLFRINYNEFLLKKKEYISGLSGFLGEELVKEKNR